MIPLLAKPDNKSGYADLKRTDPSLYCQIKGHVRTCFDPNDWGTRRAAGHPVIHVNKKDRLNDRSHCRKHPKKLSLRRIQSHCEWESTHYYTSHPTSGYAVIMHDLDAHHGEPDVDDLRTVVDGLFYDHARGYSRTYWQRSTNGEGWHGYSVIDWRGWTARRFRALLRYLQRSVRRLCSDTFKARYEVKGSPGLTCRDGIYVTCGLLAKIPRLPTADHWRDYLNATPAILVDDLIRIAHECDPPRFFPVQELYPIEMQRGLEAIWTLPIETVQELYPKKEKQREHPSSTTVSERKNSTSILCSRVISVVEREEGSTLSSEPDPAKRMNRCGWELAMKLRRPPTSDEILRSYHERGLNTGDDHDGNRAKLATDSATWLLVNFRAVVGDGYDREKFMGLVHKHVTDDIRKSVRKHNRNDFTDEMASVVLYCITRATTTPASRGYWKGTSSINGALMMAKVLGVEWSATGAKERVSACRLALKLSGLVEEDDRGFTIGRAKGWRLTLLHPDYHQQIHFQDQKGM